MRKVAVAAMILMLGLGLSACGSDDDSSSSDTTAQASTENSTAAPPVQLSGKVTDKGTKDVTGADELEVEADDFYFEPTFIKVTAGQKLTLKLKNEGDATHTFTSTALGVDKELKPGDTATVEITAPNADSAAFFCRFHQGGGMQGALFTKAGASAGSDSTVTTAASSNGY